ncbi:MAG: septum formation initiator family protein [Lachnospiraceae bacterium]|nr:septum formation initiator family protein [Lachnospiraceae bacterium]
MKKTRGSKQKKKTGRGSIAIIVILLLIVMSLQTYRLYNKNQEYIAEEEELQKKLEEETERQQELKEYEEQLGSDEYTEKEAHNKLGMLYDNEIIYKEED